MIFKILIIPQIIRYFRKELFKQVCLQVVTTLNSIVAPRYLRLSTFVCTNYVSQELTTTHVDSYNVIMLQDNETKLFKQFTSSAVMSGTKILEKLNFETKTGTL